MAYKQTLRKGDLENAGNDVFLNFIQDGAAKRGIVAEKKQLLLWAASHIKRKR